MLCMCMYMDVHMDVHRYVQRYRCMYVCMYVCMYTCTCMIRCIHVHVWFDVWCICMIYMYDMYVLVRYVCTYIYIYIYMYIYVCMKIGLHLYEWFWLYIFLCCLLVDMLSSSWFHIVNICDRSSLLEKTSEIYACNISAVKEYICPLCLKRGSRRLQVSLCVYGSCF